MKFEKQPAPKPSDEEVLDYLEYDLDFTHVQVLKTRLSVDYENHRPFYHLGGKIALCIIGLGATAWGLQALSAEAPAEDVINLRQINLESSALSDGFEPAQSYMDSDGRQLKFIQKFGKCFLNISTVERPVMAEPGMTTPENNYLADDPSNNGSRSLITDFTTLKTLREFSQCRIENSK